MYSAPIACSASPRSKGAAHRRIAVDLQQLVQPLHVVNPYLQSSMGELGEIRQRGRAEIEQMLALQIAPSPFPRDRGDSLGAVLRQNRAIAGLEFPHVVGPE